MRLIVTVCKEGDVGSLLSVLSVYCTVFVAECFQHNVRSVSVFSVSVHSTVFVVQFECL